MGLNVGCRLTELSDVAQDARIPLALLYPTQQPEQTERFGPYALDVARDAPLDGQRVALIAISHGNGGSPWVHRDLAKRLAQAGYVVALPEHTGNSRNDNSLAGTAANLANRLRHITLAIDAACADVVVGKALASDRVGVVGHSIGACTALAVAGGKPVTGPARRVMEGRILCA